MKGNAHSTIFTNLGRILRIWQNSRIFTIIETTGYAFPVYGQGCGVYGGQLLSPLSVLETPTVIM